MNYKEEEPFGLSEVKSITSLDELVFPDVIDRPDQGIEPINLHDFFEYLQIQLQNQNFCEIKEKFESVKITEYDDSFEEYEIANLAVQVITISDDPNHLNILLNSFEDLMGVDIKYIESLVQAQFIESISKVYKEVQNPDCKIKALKCAFIISKISQEYRDEVFDNFPLHEQINPFTDEILISEFDLIQSHLEYDINVEMSNAIISFLFHKISYLLDKLRNKTKSAIDKKLLDHFYICISILSDLPFWELYFLSYQDQIENPEEIENPENSEMQIDNGKTKVELLKPELVNLFFQFIQESLLSNKKSLIKFACFTLYNTISFYNISDRIELILSLIQLQAVCDIPDVIPYVCDVFCRIMYQVSDDSDLRQLIDDHQIILKVIDHLFQLFDKSSVCIKISLFKVAYTILTFYPETIPFFIEHGLMNLILEMIYYEDSDCLRYTLLILDCIFQNEEKVMQHHQFLDLFNENDGMNDLEYLMNQQFVSENQELNQMLLRFLMDYHLDSDGIVVEEA